MLGWLQQEDPPPASDLAASSDSASPWPPFSPVALRDRVVIMALFGQLVDLEQVEAAWTPWQIQRQTNKRRALWRTLAEQDGVDREGLQALAAQIYGFKTFELKPITAAEFVRRHRHYFPAAAWKGLLQHSLVPVHFKPGQTNGRYAWSFAAPDPAHPDIRRTLDRLGIDEYTLYYAAEDEVVSVLVEALDDSRRQQPTVQEALDTYRPPSTPEPDLPTPEAPPPTDESALIMALFEEALQAAVERGLPMVHFGTDAQDRLHIHLADQQGSRASTITDRLSFRAFLRQLRTEYLRDGQASALGQPIQASFQRWISDKLVRVDVDVQAYQGPPADSISDLIRVTVT
ncbi:MAG: hypothetical protein AAGI71_09685 [Bacteroidota bacterium]